MVHNTKCGHFIPRAWAPNIDGYGPNTSGRDYDHLKNLKNQALQGRLVDALARRGDERRGTLRKARVRCEQPLTPRSLNGETHLYRPRYFSLACQRLLSRFVLGIFN